MHIRGLKKSLVGEVKNNFFSKVVTNVKKRKGLKTFLVKLVSKVVTRVKRERDKKVFS